MHRHRVKEKKFNLEGLPLDILIMVVLTLDNTSDLFALIQTSNTFKRLFNRYRKSILLGICKNMVGSSEATWKTVAAVLVYQRPVNANSGRFLPDFASMRFVLEDQDIRQLRYNLRLFTSTAKKFRKYVDFPADDHITAGCSFKSGDSLAKHVFFGNWLLEFQVRYDTITTFSTRKPYSKTQLRDAALIRIAMNYCDYTYVSRSRPLWERRAHKQDKAARSRVMDHMSSCLRCVRHKKLLWLKIMYHYDFMIWKDEGGMITFTDYQSLMDQLCDDMTLRGVNYLVEKHGLSCGWDREG